MNLSALVLDQYDMLASGKYTSETLEKIAAVVGEKIAGAEDVSRQRSDDFALVMVLPGGRMSRKWPIMSKSATVMSLGSFVTNGDKLPDEPRKLAGLNIVKACERYSIDADELRAGYSPEDLKKIGNCWVVPSAWAAQEPEMQKAASARCFAITEGLEGEGLERMSITTPDELKIAMRRFSTVNFRAPFVCQMAENIVKRAEQLGIEIPEGDPINMVAGNCFSPQLIHKLAERVRKAPPENRMQYLGLIKAAQHSTPKALASALEIADMQSGLKHQWNRGLTSPVDSVFGWPKQAEELNLGRVSVDEKSLKRIASTLPDEVEAIVGESGMEGLKNDPMQTFMALPQPNQQALVSLLESAS